MGESSRIRYEMEKPFQAIREGVAVLDPSHVVAFLTAMAEEFMGEDAPCLPEISTRGEMAEWFWVCFEQTSEMNRHWYRCMQAPRRLSAQEIQVKFGNWSVGVVEVTLSYVGPELYDVLVRFRLGSEWARIETLIQRTATEVVDCRVELAIDYD